jgi:hypothetical protein
VGNDEHASPRSRGGRSVGDGRCAGSSRWWRSATDHRNGRRDEDVDVLDRGDPGERHRGRRKRDHRADLGPQSIRLIDQLNPVTVVIGVGQDGRALTVAMVMRRHPGPRGRQNNGQKKGSYSSDVPPVHAGSIARHPSRVKPQPSRQEPVTRVGLEPTAYGLKVRCSTS